MIPLFLWSGTTANAWECEVTSGCGCNWADGNQLTYHININDFSSSGQGAIEDGADAWDAGAGENVRGANWDFIRGSDITSDGTPGNWTNEVYKEPDTFFAGLGLSGATAVTLYSYLLCGRRDTDVVLRESFTYTSAMPSDADDPGEVPIGGVAVHEFGHVLGLAHNDETQTADPAAMNAQGHDQDIGGYYRINEDDYIGLIEDKANSSAGKNLMLQKYYKPTNPNTTPIEVWQTTQDSWEGDWEGCPTQTISDGPHEIMSIIIGTSSQSPMIEWRLSADSTCFSGTEYTLGTRTPNISSNTPYPVTPSGGYYIPSTVPYGNYYVCAKIDVGDFISETNESDNVVRSEALFNVHSCP